MEGPPYAAAGLRGALAVPLRPLAGVGGLQAPKLALDDTPEKVRPVFVFSQYAGDAEKGLQGRRLVVEIRDYWLATSGRSAHSSFAQKGSGETLGIQCCCLTADAAGQVVGSIVISPTFLSIASTLSLPNTSPTTT
jgi:hypothetical protein